MFTGQLSLSIYKGQFPATVLIKDSYTNLLNTSDLRWKVVKAHLCQSLAFFTTEAKGRGRQGYLQQILIHT